MTRAMKHQYALLLSSLDRYETHIHSCDRLTDCLSYEYWPNGGHQRLSQVLLTPGIIFGRFKIGQDTPTRPINLILGVGYQVAVTANPVTQNNLVGTIRITF